MPPMPTETPTLRDLWMQAATRLDGAGIADARFEAEVLLRHASARDRAAFYAGLTDLMEPQQADAFEASIQRRLERVPLAYITGVREFYKLEFQVTPDVLIPRPESELLVETALAHLRRQRIRGARVVDVGAGSGALGIAIARHRRDVRLLGMDVSRPALRVAAANARRLIPRRHVDWMQADLLTPVSGAVECVVANLPYVDEARLPDLEPEVAEHEPRQALTPGAGGLQLNLRLVTQLGARLAPRGIAVLEIDPGQEEAVVDAAQRLIPLADIEVLNDLAGEPRVVKIVAR